MPQCVSCGKKGLFLKIEEDTGLCLSCNEAFAKDGKKLTAGIMDAKSLATAASDREEIRQHARTIEELGGRLIDLHKRFGMTPSQELLDLIATYREKAK